MAAVLLAPALIVLGLDVGRRGRHLLTFDLAHCFGYLGSFALSAVFWATWLTTASRRRSRLGWPAAVWFGLSFTVVVAVQAGFFRYYSVYCSQDAMLEYRDTLTTWSCALPFDGRSMLAAYLPAAALLSASLVYASRSVVRIRRTASRIVTGLCVPLLVAMILLPVSYRRFQSSMPDQIFMNGMGVAAREQIPMTRKIPIARTQRRRPVTLPPLTSKNQQPRNVLFILQESVREDAYCSDYQETCEKAGRHANYVLPDRLPLSRMRSVTSSTVIASSVLLSGYSPLEDSRTLHSVPYLFGYAKAAGYSTAYWTSQDVMLFGMRFLFQDQPLDIMTVGTHLDLGCDGDTGARDGLVVDRVLKDLATLKEPFFGMMQLSSVHFPYLIDEADAPYSADPEQSRKAQVARYHNAVYYSDRETARLLSAIRDSALGDRTIIVFTSDHAESLWEHGWDGHTKTVFDTELRVPAWIWARDGVLSTSERAYLKKARLEQTFHLDLAPTMLDLMGLWDAPEIQSHRAKMPGHPLTRRERTTEAVPLTNCSWIWQCRNPSIGMMKFPFKVAARGKESRFSCFNLREDPQEKRDLGEDGCGELATQAHELFGFMPSDLKTDQNPPK